ncbi:hypothetical protein [Actinoplanes subtropicus]|uniref:hypothetical protein n=1 Tax=Actinoplanes subtropicus TaxID=543632 RepID=UPI0012F77EB3|nr:hypothetical protein [Actinoplanes subtropicus]
MTVLDTALRKALAGAARFLPQLTQRAEAALVADHQPITGTGNLYGNGGARFWLNVAVAPNHSPETLDPPAFVDAANELAAVFFEDAPFHADYSGNLEVRLVEGAPTENSSWGDANTLRIFPSGLVMLQWVLRATPLPDGQPGFELSLDEIVTVLRRAYALAHSPQFAATHRRRRWVRHRFDWRMGLSPSISGTQGPAFWRRLSSAAPLPERVPTRQNPHCPFDGYAAAAMRDRKVTDSVEDTFRPALQELFTSSGFSGRISQAVAAALAEPAAARSLGTPTREITAG